MDGLAWQFLTSLFSEFASLFPSFLILILILILFHVMICHS